LAIEVSRIQELREKTGAGILDCRKALAEAGGDISRAIVWLREKGLAMAKKKADRPTHEGVIGSYIHPGSGLGVLVEVNCETDFVARTDDFQELVRNIAMQVAASGPEYLTRESVPPDVVEREKGIYRTQARESGKPAPVVERIVEGKLEKFFSEVCLLEQPFVKDPEKNVIELLNQKIAKLGENITVRRFTRYRLGEE
jgi:elongation factor Ts